MERLTCKHFGAEDYYMECSSKCDNLDDCGDCPKLQEIINKLGAYEDTDLEPDDVVDLMGSHSEAIRTICDMKKDEGCSWCSPGHEVCGTCARFFAGLAEGCATESTDGKCAAYTPADFCMKCGRKLRKKG